MEDHIRIVEKTIADVGFTKARNHLMSEIRKELSGRSVEDFNKAVSSGKIPLYIKSGYLYLYSRNTNVERAKIKKELSDRLKSLMTKRNLVRMAVAIAATAAGVVLAKNPEAAKRLYSTAKALAGNREVRRMSIASSQNWLSYSPRSVESILRSSPRRIDSPRSERLLTPLAEDLPDEFVPRTPQRHLSPGKVVEGRISGRSSSTPMSRPEPRRAPGSTRQRAREVTPNPSRVSPGHTRSGRRIRQPQL